MLRAAGREPTRWHRVIPSPRAATHAYLPITTSTTDAERGSCQPSYRAAIQSQRGSAVALSVSNKDTIPSFISCTEHGSEALNMGLSYWAWQHGSSLNMGLNKREVSIELLT